VSEFYSSIPLHAGLWKAIKALNESHPELTPARQRLLTRLSIRSAAWRLNWTTQARSAWAEIDVALSRATTKFSENVLDSTNAFDW